MFGYVCFQSFYLTIVFGFLCSPHWLFARLLAWRMHSTFCYVLFRGFVFHAPASNWWLERNMMSSKHRVHLPTYGASLYLITVSFFVLFPFSSFFHFLAPFKRPFLLPPWNHRTGALHRRMLPPWATRGGLRRQHPFAGTRRGGTRRGGRGACGAFLPVPFGSCVRWRNSIFLFPETSRNTIFPFSEDNLDIRKSSLSFFLVMLMFFCHRLTPSSPKVRTPLKLANAPAPPAGRVRGSRQPVSKEVKNLPVEKLEPWISKMTMGQNLKTKVS